MGFPINVSMLLLGLVILLALMVGGLLIIYVVWTRRGPK
jgi:hypothetical protein